jgi:hypothetical protein
VDQYDTDSKAIRITRKAIGKSLEGIKMPPENHMNHMDAIEKP